MEDYWAKDVVRLLGPIPALATALGTMYFLDFKNDPTTRCTVSLRAMLPGT